MNKYTKIVIIILVLGVFAAIGTITSAQDQDMKTTNYVDVTPVDQPGNITKLEILPPYGNIRLQPGESSETTVIVKNNEDKPVSVVPIITTMPYGPYIVDTSWITITPASAEIPAGGNLKFTINVSVPKDATTGNYGAQIAFTDEMMSTPYPQPMPAYAHAFQLSIDVWKQPNLQVAIPFISDQLESGKAYDYEIKIKNVGDKTIGISPKLVSDMYYGPYGMSAPILTDESITINAPQSVAAGVIETINIHVNVPIDIMGYYNGYIDLRPDDLSTKEGEARVALNLNIWKQPTEPFVKNFTLDKLSPITIEISSYSNKYPYLKTQREDPSFETIIVGPEGEIKPNVTKTVIKGNINMGSDKPSWATDDTSVYQNSGSQHIITYKTDGSPGEWKLNVLPKNTQGFDYSITVGE